MPVRCVDILYYYIVCCAESASSSARATPTMSARKIAALLWLPLLLFGLVQGEEGERSQPFVCLVVWHILLLLCTCLLVCPYSGWGEKSPFKKEPYFSPLQIVCKATLLQGNLTGGKRRKIFFSFGHHSRLSSPPLYSLSLPLRNLRGSKNQLRR